MKNKFPSTDDFLRQPFTITPTPKSLQNNILKKFTDNNREHGRLPMNLVCDILVRLPIEDILRCKCVCKCWRDEISSPYFINSHTCHVQNNDSNTCTSSVVVFSVLERTLMSINFNSWNNIKIRPIIHNTSIKDKPLLVGSCNGLLCFSNIFNVSREIRTKGFSLYNPITGASKVVPKLERLNPDLRNGFGYDCTSGDYKIFSLALDPKDWMTTYSCVYSLKRNSWAVRNLDKPYISSDGIWSCMVLSNNSLHYITWQKKLLGFDLGRERFHEVPMPSDEQLNLSDYGPRFELVNLRGYLHLVTLTDIWIMKEYGVQKSWTKLFSFSQVIESAKFDRYSLGKDWVRPFTCSKDGREILVAILTDYGSNIFCSLDVQNRKFKKLEDSSLPQDWEYWTRYCFVMPWTGSFMDLSS